MSAAVGVGPRDEFRAAVVLDNIGFAILLAAVVETVLWKRCSKLEPAVDGACVVFERIEPPMGSIAKA
jgi:hypothetical protein